MGLNSFLSPLIDIQEFSENYWGKQPYYNQNCSSSMQELLTWDYMKNLLSDPITFQSTEVLLRSSAFHNDQPKPKSFDEVKVGIKCGLTLQVRKLQNILPSSMKIMKLAKTMEKTLLHPLDSITFFYSLPSSVPTAIHKDIGEIFSVQQSGKKHWKIAFEKCITNQMWFKEGEITNWNEYILEGGHCMYLPSYLPHQVKCVEEPSASVAFVFRNIKFETILWCLMEEKGLIKELIKPLPIMGFPSIQGAVETQISNFFASLKKTIDTASPKQFLEKIRMDLSNELIR